MEIEYKLDESDFLTFQLYVASKSERIIKNRQKSKFLLPLIYVAFGVISYLDNKAGLGVTFIALGILWFFIFPLWNARRYKNHYKKFIHENYQQRCNRIEKLTLNQAYILAKNEGGESKIPTSEVMEIIEIPNSTFIKFKTGESLILPKSKIADYNQLTVWLKEWAGKLKVNYSQESNWKWK